MTKLEQAKEKALDAILESVDGQEIYSAAKAYQTLCQSVTGLPYYISNRTATGAKIEETDKLVEKEVT